MCERLKCRRAWDNDGHKDGEYVVPCSSSNQDQLSAWIRGTVCHPKGINRGSYYRVFNAAIGIPAI